MLDRSVRIVLPTRLRDRSRRLVRVDTFVSARIYRRRDVVVRCPALDRRIGVIESVDQ
jgi:hypothetical protein